MTFSIPRRPRLFLAGFLALAAIVAGASGCSSSDEVSRQAGNLGTRVCILNSWTEKVSIEYAKKDTSTREGNLSPGEQSCAEGTFAFGEDVKGMLVLPEPARALYVQASNPWVSPPQFVLQQLEENNPIDPQPSSLTNLCIKKSVYRDGDTGVWDNGTIRVSVKRLPDDQWKEFILVIEPSQGQRVGSDPCNYETDGGGLAA